MSFIIYFKPAVLPVGAATRLIVLSYSYPIKKKELIKK